MGIIASSLLDCYEEGDNVYTSSSSSTGTVRSDFKMRTLLGKDEGSIHLFIDISVVGNGQDQFQGHVFKCRLNDQRSCII